MLHNLYLFAAHFEVLRTYRELLPHAALYRLSPASDLAVLPVDEALLDDLHRAYGTGEWLDTVRLTSADMAFAADASKRGALAYLETDYDGANGSEAAAFWTGGALAIRPLVMAAEQGERRPRATWPINAVLRELGVIASPGLDEVATFRLDRYASNAVIAARALAVG